MCLVCFINAEESRARQKDSYCLPSGTTTSSVSDDNLDSSDDGNSTDTDSISTSHAIHYFAIGSMTNMTALALRELTPISSQPAMLKGYRMLFRGSGGMATAEKEGEYEILKEYDSPEYPFSCIHGVLHLLCAPQMKVRLFALNRPIILPLTYIFSHRSSMTSKEATTARPSRCCCTTAAPK